MKKALLSLIMLALLSSAAAGIFVLWEQKKSSDQVTSLTLEIVEHAFSRWEAFLFIESMDDEFYQVMTAGEFQQHFKRLSYLGQLQELRDIEYDVSIPLPWQTAPATARYTMQAYFSEGTLSIELELVQRGPRWFFRTISLHTSSMMS